MERHGDRPSLNSRIPCRRVAEAHRVEALLTTIGAAGGRRFVNDDLAEARAAGIELFPEPGSHQLDGRVFEARDVVQIGVIQLRYERFHRFAYLRVIVNPSSFRANLSLN